MHPLPAKRVVPSGPRYLAVDLPGRDVHHFRLPTYGLCATIIRLYADESKAIRPPVTDADAAQAEMRADMAREMVGLCVGDAPEIADLRARLLALADAPVRSLPTWSDAIAMEERVNGAILGLAWFNQVADLDTMRAEGESLTAYGARVADELEERGYTYAEIQHLGTAVYNAIIAHHNAGQKLKTEARAEGNGLPA
jgi:hypothetical protein